VNTDAALTVGDRVIVTGGYDFEPAWLANRPAGCVGMIVDFIPGQNEQPAAGRRSGKRRVGGDLAGDS
jgi:hypothetical protein